MERKPETKQGIGETEVGFDELERAFELLMINACGWRNGVQLLRDAGKEPNGKKSVKIRAGVMDGMMRPIGPPPPPPKDDAECWDLMKPIDTYINDVRNILKAYFEALEGLGGSPSDPGEHYS